MWHTVRASAPEPRPHVHVNDSKKRVSALRTSGDGNGRRDVSEALREAIVAGDYAPNQRLVEADLAAEYGASRASVRNALLKLASEGLVEQVQNRGSRVRAVSLDEAIEISEIRAVVEGLVAARAAERLTEVGAARLRDLRQLILDAVERNDLMTYSALNQDLDRTLVEIAGQHTAAQVIERLRAQIVRHQFRLALRPGRAQISAPEHCAIIDAVLARDPRAAEAATRAHMQSVIDALREADAAPSR